MAWWPFLASQSVPLPKTGRQHSPGWNHRTPPVPAAWLRGKRSLRRSRCPGSAVQFSRDHSGRARTEEWIEDEIPVPAAGQDQLRHELLRLLCRMVGVFRHRPERHGEVGPEIGWMGQAKITLGCLLPVFGLAVDAIGRNHPALELHRLDVEVVVVGNGREPYVLARVLPVGLRAPPFLALPRDAVAHDRPRSSTRCKADDDLQSPQTYRLAVGLSSGNISTSHPSNHSSYSASDICRNEDAPNSLVRL